MILQINRGSGGKGLPDDPPDFIDLVGFSQTFCAIHIELFPFMYPIICATEYLGGIDINI